MAHPSKFVSVNLNKSYGQPSIAPSSSSSSSSAFPHGRPRHGGSGGGMVVLSRPRSSGSGAPKGPPKLSVPSPLNLPSRRKEHERFDSSSAPGASTRPGSSGFGSGSGSSTTGWTKPSPASAVRLADQTDGSSQYMPPSARAASAPSLVEKAVFLRGEDFPTLRATVASSSKPKDTPTQKPKPELQVPLDMRPQMRSSRPTTASSVPEKDESSGSSAPEQSKKQDGYLPGPLPVVQLSHSSDWADDERDTALSFPERDRVRDFSKPDALDVPSKEFFRGDQFGRDGAGLGRESRDASSWRTQQQRDGPSFREIGADRERIGSKPFGVSGEINKESSHGGALRINNAWGNTSNGQEIRYGRVDLVSATSNRTNSAETFVGRATDPNNRARYADLASNRFRGESLPNTTMPKGPFSSGSKGFSLNDPILNFGREKRINSNIGKPYLENAGLDSSDPFSGGLTGEMNAKVFKRKKDVPKEADFHDPVRESFEAELERVQRMQEMERQRVMEEQAKAVELARREREERERLIREEEERRRQIEEEAREAAWRAEQEKLEAGRRAEQQKIAREEERKRILLEEERRKEAARKKLFELEARIAKRQADASQKDDKPSPALDDERLPGPAKERDALKVADVGDWEDSERMVEHITSTTSSDSSSMNRYFDTGSRSQSIRDANSSFMERGKHAINWRRDAYDSGNNSVFLLQDQDNDYHNSRRDASAVGRGFSRKEFHGNIGAPVRSSYKGGTSEPSHTLEEFHNPRGSRWKVTEDGDYFNRNSELDAEFLETNKFGDDIWGPDHSRGIPHAPFAENSYKNPDPEVDGYSSSGRSRLSLRQPRVLPPPSVSSIRKNPYTASTEHPDSSLLFDNEARYQRAQRTEEASYRQSYHDNLQQPGTTTLLDNSVPSEQQNTNSLRCDSQSSLSVSSPPSSPTQLSHDDLDEPQDSQTPPSIGEQAALPVSDHIVSSTEVGNANSVVTSSSISLEEDDEWGTENHETAQEQEEYDEDGDGYQEEEEAHEATYEKAELVQEYEDMQSDVADKSDEADQVVLGFDEGVEFKIHSNDEFGKSSTNSEMTVGVQANSISAAQEPISTGDDIPEAENSFPQGTSSGSNNISETEIAPKDLVSDPVSATSVAPDTVEAISARMPSQQPISSASSSPMPSASSSQPSLSLVSNVTGQPEAPFKLQFGLFSGPSLIPSPVPAIQIGSIQMPLHLHSQVGPSITHMHSSQPPFFQFGQLRYTSPISQGILPLAPQTMSFVRPSASTNFSVNQNLGVNARNQESQTSTLNNSVDKVVSAPLPLDKQPTIVTKPLDLPQDNIGSRQINALKDRSKKAGTSHSQTGISSSVEVKNRYAATQTERHGNRDFNSKKNYRPVVNNKESQLHYEYNQSRIFSGEKAINGSKASGMPSGGRGRRFAYTVRNSGSRPLFSGGETSFPDSSGFHRRPGRNIRRTEFRVRENTDKRSTEVMESNSAPEGKSNFKNKLPGNSARYGVKNDAVLSKPTKTAIESENANSGASVTPRPLVSDGKMGKSHGKEAASKKRMSSLQNSHEGEGNIRRNGSSEEDIDAPLQSGVVRVFKQPGIEAPSDEDDFIQVRSKRQMLNDRREQREKEIKAKSRVIKAPRKQRAISQSNTVTSSSNRAVSSLGGDASNKVRSNSVLSDGRRFIAGAHIESSPVSTASISPQSLPPIGTIAGNVDSDTPSRILKSGKTSTVPAISNIGTEFTQSTSFGNKNGNLDSVMPLGTWDNVDASQQVMSLTQSQLDEAMQPARFDSHVTSSIAHEPIKASVSIMAQENTFSSLASPLNSLFAGEKIQFGAVTSPSIPTPVSRAIANGIGPPSSGRLDVAITPKLPGSEKDCASYFDKEKRHSKSYAHTGDPESEAEAAASAVAVAAISNSDDNVGNHLDGCSVLVLDTKSFSGSDATMLTSEGISANQERIGQSAAEESLTVALPADLSVDTPSLPLWSPLPSPQSSSGPMLSHFPVVPPSHFPCFEMNPMLGGPIFAFGPHDESGVTQVQQQRNTTLGSGSIGAWPQCHSTMDSFYGPPAGFTGPFISPPGGIPGVQGPHMVVYNHFTPVGQFGQVGLSFMGTTYIPTGKQPDWKHNPASSAMSVGECDISNLNVASGQRNLPSMPAHIQHMPPGAPLIPMPSPLTMFDVPSFQSPGDMPRWSHIPAPPIHSVPLSVPLQQHQVNGMPSQFSHGLPVDNSIGGNNRLNELRPSADSTRNLPVPKDSSQFPGEPGLLESSASTENIKTIGPSSGNSASGNDFKGSKVSESSAGMAAASGESSSINNVGHVVSTSVKTHGSQQPHSSGQQYLHPIGYTDQRGSGTSQKTGSSGGEWHRRMGYQGRNQSLSLDKNFPAPKVKQIYVAKAPRGNAATG